MARNHPTKEQYRELARVEYATREGIKVPEKARVSRYELQGGAWVEAVVWINDSDLEET
jgi:hypothetical protein